MSWYPYQQRAVFNASTAVAQEFVVGVGTGYKTARGVVTLDGGNPTPVATGLTGVLGAAATLVSTAFTTGDPVTVTVQWSSATGNLDIYAWKFTSTAVTNLVATTSSGFNVSWIATGI